MKDTPRPTPTSDLDAVDEVHEMVRRFYADVAQDELLPLFHETLDLAWTGPVADRAHELAGSVARVHRPQLLVPGSPVRSI